MAPTGKSLPLSQNPSLSILYDYRICSKHSQSDEVLGDVRSAQGGPFLFGSVVLLRRDQGFLTVGAIGCYEGLIAKLSQTPAQLD